MFRTGLLLLAVAMCALLVACDNDTSPSGPVVAGQWTGTTSQGSPISFAVAADEKVTTITVGHSFNGCSGSQTFPDLSLDTVPNVMCIPAPCSPSLQSFRSFNYSAGPFEGPSTTIHGLFPLPGSAQGQVAFRGFPDCGTAVASWVATRR